VPSAHRETHHRHIVMSPEVISASCHNIPITSRSSSMVALQFFLGLPLFLCPPFGIHFIAWRANLLFSILCTWPSHLNRFLLKVSSISLIPVLCLTSIFVILCFQVIPKMLFNHLWWSASNFLLFVTVTDHVSLPYFHILLTQANHTTYLFRSNS